MIWFTSDLHLGHRAAISMCGRPFRNVEDIEFNEELPDFLKDEEFIRVEGDDVDAI